MYNLSIPGDILVQDKPGILFKYEKGYIEFTSQ